MNNSQQHVLAVIHKDFSSLTLSCKRVTGSLSCLLEEAEDWGVYSNSCYWYYLWYQLEDGDHIGMSFDSYTDLLQYLQKGVSNGKEETRT